MWHRRQKRNWKTDNLLITINRILGQMDSYAGISIDLDMWNTSPHNIALVLLLSAVDGVRAGIKHYLTLHIQYFILFWKSLLENTCLYKGNWLSFILQQDNERCQHEAGLLIIPQVAQRNDHSDVFHLNTKYPWHVVRQAWTFRPMRASLGLRWFSPSLSKEKQVYIFKGRKHKHKFMS